MRIEVSREEELLDTGGGLKKAAHFFLDARVNPSSYTMSMSSATSIWRRMMRFHIENTALATLAVQPRATSRYLLFDELGQLKYGGSAQAR